MENTEFLELGDKMKCGITGFEGVATGHIRHIFNCDRFLLQPTSLNEKTGQPIESHWFDVTTLTVTEKNAHPVTPVTLVVPTLDRMAEQPAKDRVSGYEGKVVSLLTSINGCIRIGVQAAGKNNEGQALQTEYLPFQALNIEVKPPVDGEEATADAKVQVSKKADRPGGPMRGEPKSTLSVPTRF